MNSAPDNGKGRLAAEMVAISTIGSQNAEPKSENPKIILVMLVPITVRTWSMAGPIIWLASISGLRK